MAIISSVVGVLFMCSQNERTRPSAVCGAVPDVVDVVAVVGTVVVVGRDVVVVVLFDDVVVPVVVVVLAVVGAVEPLGGRRARRVP
nr:hypothetical protein GCM10017745_55590 [Saccharothrix mutabilis subsp. capreolus]